MNNDDSEILQPNVNLQTYFEFLFKCSLSNQWWWW